MARYFMYMAKAEVMVYRELRRSVDFVNREW